MKTQHFGTFSIFHISPASVPKYCFFSLFIACCFLYFPHFTYKNPKILFCVLNVKKYKKSRTIGFLFLRISSIFHFQKYQNLLFFVFFFLGGFGIFHTSPPRIRFRAIEYFPHLLCRFSSSRNPEHFVIACILLLSVSDFPKGSPFRLPKWKRCEFENLVFDEFFRVLYIHTHA